MYRLCLENRKTKKIFFEDISSPYLLRVRLESLKYSRKLKVKYLLRS